MLLSQGKYSNIGTQSSNFTVSLSLNYSIQGSMISWKAIALLTFLLTSLSFSNNYPISQDMLQASTILVNTTHDELNNDGDCSLREAIQAANYDTVVDHCSAGNGEDTILLPAGTYPMGFPALTKTITRLLTGISPAA